MRLPRPRARTLLATLLAAVLLVSGAGLVLWATLPDVTPLARENPARTAYIDAYLDARARDGAPANLRWTWVDGRAISPHLKRAVLVAEDIDFFSHDGFDTHEIGQAVRTGWEERTFPRGASTLTMQLARNLYLSPARTPWRKATEALVTRRLEAALSKDRILEIYLNVVEFGPGIYGAEAASRHYFGRPAAALDERQAAQLAAVLPRPSVWHPGRDSRGYRAAVDRILRRMEKAQFLWRRIGATPPGP